MSPARTHHARPAASRQSILAIEDYDKIVATLLDARRFHLAYRLVMEPDWILSGETLFRVAMFFVKHGTVEERQYVRDVVRRGLRERSFTPTQCQTLVREGRTRFPDGLWVALENS